MGKKQILFKTTGMNLDLSVSAFNPDFAFENYNLRLSTNEANTSLSWVNEKGTLPLEIENINTTPWDAVETTSNSIQGHPVGTAVIDHKLVLFTKEVINNEQDLDKDTKSNANDHIYVLWYDESSSDAKTRITGKLIYTGKLNFHDSHPLETHTYYESVDILKVYWVDGINQPRMINIMANQETLKKWNDVGDPEGSKDNTKFFDFVTVTGETPTVLIQKNIIGGGMFPPGVIQYCLSYINKYGQLTNLVYVSDLYYLTREERGISPDDKASCSFTLEIEGFNRDFDYIRLYSILRTSVDTQPLVKIIDDILIPKNPDETTVYYTDTGVNGASIDPMELLLVGGREIKAYTMCDKDNTLFLGNIEEINAYPLEIQDYFDDNREDTEGAETGIQFTNESSSKEITLNHTEGIYGYTNMLNHSSREITTFKGGDTYRFGFLLQKKTGEWTEPIYLGDVTNDKYPVTDIFTDTIKLVSAKYTIPFDTIFEGNDSGKEAFLNTYLKVRPVIVYPKITDRNVLCLGVLNPTVFNVEDRINNSPYALPSWFFRPYFIDNQNNLTYNKFYSNKYCSVFLYENLNTNLDGLANVGSNPSHYILILLANNNEISTILVNRYIEKDVPSHAPLFPSPEPSQQIGDDDELLPSTWSFDGVVLLQKGRKSSQYAFISSTDLINSNDLFLINGHPAFMPEMALINSLLFSELTTDDDGYFFFSALTNDDTQLNKSINFYSIKSDDSKTYWKLIFTPTTQASTAEDREKGSSITTNEVGRDLEYRHYYKIPSLSEAPSNFEHLSIEILGSLKIYDNPFKNAETESSEGKSNTQFFIDLSIVTLNSPDIDFDNEVIRFGEGAFSLHIIGVIPITSYVSAHNIIASTNTIKNFLEEEDDTPSEVVFGKKELPINVQHNNIDTFASRRLISDYLWNDIKYNGEENEVVDFLVYPWLRTGSLTNDPRNTEEAQSVLETKKESSLLYSINTKYIDIDLTSGVFNNLEFQIVLALDFVNNTKFKKQNAVSTDFNYYNNIDKILTNQYGYTSVIKNNSEPIDEKFYSPISMKYRSSSHGVISLRALNSDDISILPCATINTTSIGLGKLEGESGENAYPFWSGKPLKFSLKSLNVTNAFTLNTFGLGDSSNSDTAIALSFLWLGEIHKNVAEETRFGGTSETALRNNTWTIAGEEKILKESNGSINIEIEWTEGDTYYQRYDCLKTYPFTDLDTNLLVEILSFMCETHVNIDGRYDRNRGLLDNTNMSPINFNLLNPGYTLKNNFFTYNKVTHLEDTSKFPNLITWTLTKESGADVDLWTKINLGSNLELDGNKGEIKSINRFNNQLIAFQDSGISLIKYNEDVAIATQQGVPIEIANSGKVSGVRYISDTIGCSNKWSITNSPSGIYFMDSNEKSIYLFNGEFKNISTASGFNSWCKKNIPSSKYIWNLIESRPVQWSAFRSFYDKRNQEVLFINDGNALAFSEKTGTFTSFYSYLGVKFFDSLEDTEIISRIGTETSSTDLWKYQAGDYCKFFGINHRYYTTLVVNPEPLVDKIFTNIELRATVTGEGINDETQHKLELFTPFTPFDTLETWNEYLHGITNLTTVHSYKKFDHHYNYGLPSNNESSLKRKFRIWRCDIPRDNVPVPNGVDAPYRLDENLGITRFKAHPLDRMRNTWLYLNLGKIVTPSSEDTSYTNEEVDAHNRNIPGAVFAGDTWIDTFLDENENYVYTTYHHSTETANLHNLHIPGAWQYGRIKNSVNSLNKTEIHDITVDYFT